MWEELSLVVRRPGFPAGALKVVVDKTDLPEKIGES